MQFDISDTEYEKFEEWRAEHDKICKYADPLKCGAIGGRWKYCSYDFRDGY